MRNGAILLWDYSVHRIERFSGLDVRQATIFGKRCNDGITDIQDAARLVEAGRL